MAMVDELPQDLLMEILSRLPVKSILQLKSVSKNWYSLIQNPIFISLHHTRARLYCCVSLIMVHIQNRNIGVAPQRSMCLFPDQISIQYLDLSFTRPHLNKEFMIARENSCNGLTCLSQKSNIVICNPATRECRLLPRSPYHAWRTKGFAFDSETSDYKVVRLATLSETTLVDHKIHIYGMSADSWKEIAAMVPNHDFTVRHSPCTSLDGVFYWLSYVPSTRVHAIDALNTIEGSFKRRSLPAGISSDGKINLSFRNDSLSLVEIKYDNQRRETWFDVWLMDEFGVEGFWTKKYTIGPLLGRHILHGFWPNSEVLLAECENKIVSYNYSTHYIAEYKQLCDLPEPRFITRVFPYSESLVSVKRRVDLA